MVSDKVHHYFSKATDMSKDKLIFILPDCDTDAGAVSDLEAFDRRIDRVRPVSMRFCCIC